MGLDNRWPRGFSDRKIAAWGHCAGVGVTQGRGEGSITAGGLRQAFQALFTSEQRPLKASTNRSPVNPLKSGGWRPTLAPSPADCPRRPAGGTGPVASGAQLPGFSLELGSGHRPQVWVRSGEFTSWDCGGTHRGAALEPGFVTATSGQQASRRWSSCAQRADGCSQGHAVSLEASSLSL